MMDRIISEGPLAEYAKQMGKIMGTEVVALHSQDTGEPPHGFKGPFLLARIGGTIAADKAIDALVVLRKKAGVAENAMLLTYEAHSGDIVIPLSGFEPQNRALFPATVFPAIDPMKVETTFGQDVIDKLRIVQPDIEQAIRTAKREADAMKNLPSYAPFDADVRNDADRRVRLVRGGNPSFGHHIEHLHHNLQFPDFIKDGALEAAKSLRVAMQAAGLEDPSKTRELGYVAHIDGDPKTVSDAELAAYLLAKGLGPVGYHNTLPPVLPTADFDSSYPISSYKGEDYDLKVVFEAARQIFGDTYREQIKGGVDTTTPEGNKRYHDAVMKSPTTLVFR